MNKKFSKEELLKIADTGLVDMSCEQIKALIKKESSKDYEEINTDLIDLCFDVLAMKRENKPILINEPNSKIGFKKNTAKKVLIFAAVIMIFIATTLTVSASVFHFNIPKEIATWIEGNAKMDINLKLADTTADGYSLENSDLVNRLRTYGLFPVTIPEEMIKENSKIIKVDNITADISISTDIKIEFIYNNSLGRLVISQYTENFEWSGEMVSKDVLSAEMIKVNGMDVLIFEQENNSCTICYKDNFTTYEIYLETDFETARLFAQSIQ